MAVSNTDTVFRKEVYDYLIHNLSSVMYEDDIDIFVTLICYVFGDLWQRARLLPWEIDFDHCDEEYLRGLSGNIGYKWNEALTADQQREAMKLYCLVRRSRGTQFGLLNLIRVFGQDVQSYYSSADLRGVEVVEYDPDDPDRSEPKMYPGDLKIRIPELSSILRDAIDDTRLSGTRLIFTYYIFLGIYHYDLNVGIWVAIKKWMTLKHFGLDTIIENYGPEHLDTVISDISSWQISHRRRSNQMLASAQIITSYKEPWNDGFILNEPDLENYRGRVYEEPEMEADDILYE